MKADELPELPPSKLQLWELRFVDSNADGLSPRIRIDPSVATSKRAAPIEGSQVNPKPAAEPASPPPTSEKSLILQALQMQIAVQIPSLTPPSPSKTSCFRSERRQPPSQAQRKPHPGPWVGARVPISP